MFLKYLLKNMMEKKFRTLLLLISISLSVALFYITMSSNDSILKIAKQKLNTEYGETDIIVSPNERSDTNYIEDNLDDVHIEKQVPFLSLKGTHDYNEKAEDIDIVGVKFEDLNSLTKTDIISEENLQPFKENKMIISQVTSEKYNLKVGSSVEVKINNKKRKIIVCGIGKNEGILHDDSGKFKALVPYSYAETILNVKNMANMIYAKVDMNKSLDKNTVIKDLTEKYDKYDVEQLSPEDFIDGLNANLSKPLYIMLFIVLIMSSFIIYTSFNLIVLERLPVVGTFLSVGASRGMINIIFLCESIILGLIGGTIGNIIGIIGSRFLIYRNNGIGADALNYFNISFEYMFYAMILAVVVSVTSSIIPVIRTNKISIKNIILNLMENKQSKSNIAVYIGSVLIALTLIDKNLIDSKFEAYVSIFNVLAIFISTIVILNNFLRIVGKPIQLLLKDRSPISFLALSNVTSSKSLINNIRLTNICICVMIIISTVSVSIIQGLDTLYSQINADIELKGIYELKKVEDYLNADDDVKNYVELFNIYSVQVKDSSSKIQTLQGIDPDKYKDYNNYFIYDDKELELKNLKSSSRNILLSTSLLDKFNKNVGDYITLITKGNDTKEYNYKIIGTFNAQMENMGSIAVINKENAKKDFSLNKPAKISLKLKQGVSIDKYYNKISNSDIKQYVSSIVLEEDKKQNDVNENKSFIGILEGASVFCLDIGVFGILNNMLISFLQRKKELAVLASIGMNNSKKYIMLFLEALFSAGISVVVSLLSSILIVSNLEGVFKIMGTYMKVILSTEDIIKSCALAIAIILIASISTIVKAKNVSIIEEIRCE